ncbi:MAG: chemotaxis histidine kinase/response regulator CheAY2 [Calditrichia bacterium]
MSNHDEMKEIIDGFLIEAAEIFEDLSNGMVELEKNPADSDLINSIFRGFHTLKGTASFLDFTTIEKVSHRLEDLLNQVRQGKRVLSSEDVDIIFEGMDILQELIDKISSEGNDEKDVEEFINKIELYLNSDKGKSPGEKEKKKKRKSDKKVNKPTENKDDWIWEDVQVSEENVDLLEPFFDDTNDSINRMREMIEDNPQIKDILGVLDTIKNSSSFIEFDPIHVFTRDVSKKLKDTEELNKDEFSNILLILEEMIGDYRKEKKIKSKYRQYLLEGTGDSASAGIQDAPKLSTETPEDIESEEIAEVTAPSLEERVYEISEDLKDIADAFFTELEEILENLNKNFVILETDPHNPELINDIFRGVHTIKGTSGFIGFDHMVQLTHVMEDCLNKARNNELEITPDIMDILLEGIDGVIELKEKFMKTEPISYDIDDYKNRLTQAIRNMDEASVSAPANTGDESQVKKTAGKDRDITKSYLGKFTEQTIRVDVHRLDNLMDLVGELVLGRNRLVQIISNLQLSGDNHVEFSDLDEAANNVDFLTTELQSAVMKTRMVPIGRIFSKFPRMVRDLARDRGKEIELIVSGEETEVDKTVSEEIGDPLVHILRNAVDHGIESPEEREKAGKPRKGQIHLKAYHEGNSIVIECTDDGKGIDPEKIKNKAIENGLITDSEAAKLSNSEAFDLIFSPGFSTAEKVTNISGRGVGMDVVKTHVTNLNGIISIDSEIGKGTSFRLQLPLTLAIIQGLVIQVHDEVYIIPLSSVLETYRINKEEMYTVKGNYVIRLRDEVLPIVQLEEIFDIPKVKPDWDSRYVVVVGLANMRAGILVDELIGQKEIVIKSLGSYLGVIRGIGGCSILGDGRVRLIVDIGELLSLAKDARRELNVSEKNQNSGS